MCAKQQTTGVRLRCQDLNPECLCRAPRRGGERDKPMDSDDRNQRDLADLEQHELAVMVNISTALDACAFCGIDSSPEELGILEIFVPDPRRWVCHECVQELATFLA